MFEIEQEVGEDIMCLNCGRHVADTSVEEVLCIDNGALVCRMCYAVMLVGDGIIGLPNQETLLKMMREPLFEELWEGIRLVRMADHFFEIGDSDEITETD